MIKHEVAVELDTAYRDADSYKDAPNRRPIERRGVIVANAMLGGLHHATRRYSFRKGKARASNERIPFAAGSDSI
jgi:hypothetical protein